MSEAHQIALKFDRAMPRLKGEGCAPHQPEVGCKERRIELVRNGSSSEHSLRLKLQALEGQDMLFAKTKLGSVDPASITKEPGFGGRLHGLIPSEDLLRNRLAVVESRNGRK